ncbi:MAG: hypothetical protein AAGE13_03900 [Pseudomonadota bacterium]
MTFRAFPIALALSLLAPIGALANDTNRELAAENFMEADANADRMLTLQEFTRLIDLNAADNLGRAALIKRTNRYSMAFGRIDTNANGLIEVEELQALARN